MTTKTSVRNKPAAAKKSVTKTSAKSAKPSAKSDAKPSAKSAAKPSAKSAAKPYAKSAAKASAKSDAKAPASTAPAADEGRADFDALAGEYKKLTKAQVVVPRLDVQAAVTHALGVAQRVQAPALRKRFLTMEAAGFDPLMLDQLPRAARAARYAFLRLSTTAATTANAKVSLAVVQESTAVRGRMLTVCDYHLGDDSEYAAELSAIRQGHGYQDLADDLERLVTLYAKEADVVQTDTKHYVAGDAARAQKLAAQILAEVAASNPSASAEDKGGKVPAARDAANRAFAFLLSVYDEVAAAGRYLLRHEGGDEIFISLFTAGRKPRKAKPASAKPPAAT